MAHAENVLIAKILLRHGSRPDVRLWRNEVGLFWHADGVGRVSCGLVPGSSDIIGIGPGGVFIAIEVKATRQTTSDLQKKYVETITRLGGLARVISNMQEVDDLLGEP